METLKSLGVELPPVDTSTSATTSPSTTTQQPLTPEGYHQGTIPVAEAQNPATMATQKDIADTIVAGVIVALEQVVGTYGITSDAGKKILKAISMLEGIVPEGKIQEVQSQVETMIKSPTTPSVTTVPPTTPR